MHNWWPDTWEYNSRSPPPRALDGEELFTIEGSPGAQLRDNPEEREKWPESGQKPLIAAVPH